MLAAVKEEDEVILMDAMKMEIPVYAPGSGIVTEIKLKMSESVNEGRLSCCHLDQQMNWKVTFVRF